MDCIVTLEKTGSFAKGDGQFIISLVAGDELEPHVHGRSCKHELVDYHSLPDFMKHNDFILNYYRSEWPLKQTILSVFSIHNETLNIWTHLIGFFIFLALATTMIVAGNQAATLTGNDFSSASNLTTIPIRFHHELLPSFQANLTTASSSVVDFEEETTSHHHHQIPRWPFYAYLAGAMFCLLVSSACHLLACHSELTCYIMCRLDYGGISALIVTSFYPLVYYTFACDPLLRNLYMGFITVFGIASILVSLIPVFQRPEFTVVRAGLFACMGLSGLVPIMHKMIVFGDRPEAVITTVYESVMLSLYGLGVVVYALRIPERWLPGKFDLIGHSHQLWHVLVIAGAYTHYLSGLVYLSWRDIEGC